MSFIISAKVIPGAKKSEIINLENDSSGRQSFKIKVNQPPENGKANQEVIDLISKYFKIKKTTIKIISGELSRNKIVKIG